MILDMQKSEFKSFMCDTQLQCDTLVSQEMK